MSAPQYIIIGVILITTLGAFFESSADPLHSTTLDRVALALVVPLESIALVIIPPWGQWLTPSMESGSLSLWQGLLFLLLLPLPFLLVMLGIPAFVYLIVIWVGCALNGDIYDTIRERYELIYYRVFDYIVERKGR